MSFTSQQYNNLDKKQRYANARLNAQSAMTHLGWDEDMIKENLALEDHIFDKRIVKDNWTMGEINVIIRSLPKELKREIYNPEGFQPAA